MTAGFIPYTAELLLTLLLVISMREASVCFLLRPFLANRFLSFPPHTQK